MHGHLQGDFAPAGPANVQAVAQSCHSTIRGTKEMLQGQPGQLCLGRPGGSQAGSALPSLCKGNMWALSGLAKAISLWQVSCSPYSSAQKVKIIGHKEGWDLPSHCTCPRNWHPLALHCLTAPFICLCFHSSQSIIPFSTIACVCWKVCSDWHPKMYSDSQKEA